MDKKSENEDKKIFLKSYKSAEEAMFRLEEQLREVRQNKLSISVNYDGMPHGTDISDLSSYVARVDELEGEILQERYKRIETFKRIRNLIELMDNEQEKTLLTYRYLKNMKWEEICCKVGYSWQHIHRMHAKALEHFQICD